MQMRVTLGKKGIAEYEEKKSVFIGQAMPITGEEEGLAFLREVRKEYADARHHVYAYHLQNGVLARYSDDGEPQGTAGIPVLDVIRKGGFTDCIITVTRYFGGILLGAGGLVRAYTAAASAAVRDAGIVTYSSYRVFRLSVTYSDHGKLTPLLADPILITDGLAFTDRVEITLAIPEEHFDGFCRKTAEITAGRCVITDLGTRMDKK